MITYSQLPDNPEPGMAIHCPECGDTFSCNRSDYFMVPGDRPVRCGECKTNMQLIRKTMRFEVIKS